MSAGCMVVHASPEAKKTSHKRPFFGPPAPVRPAPATKRKPNLNGKVLILQYHHVVEKESRWARSIKNFRKDLERLYRLGYRPVTMSEYIDGSFNLAPGASPVVFTFDDSHPNQFKLLPDGRIDPKSAVGIWHAFAQKHPDFPVKATFYVVPSIGFGPKKHLPKKLALLKKWGSELGVHTLSHSDLSTLTDEQVKSEIAGSIEWIEKHGFEARTIALPFGVPPKNRQLLKSFEHKGRTYTLDAAVLAGSGPAPSPYAKDRRFYRMPRIQAIEGLLGITFWLDRAKAGKTPVYVSY